MKKKLTKEQIETIKIGGVGFLTEETFADICNIALRSFPSKNAKETKLVVNKILNDRKRGVVGRIIDPRRNLTVDIIDKKSKRSKFINIAIGGLYELDERLIALLNRIPIESLREHITNIKLEIENSILELESKIN